MFNVAHNVNVYHCTGSNNNKQFLGKSLIIMGPFVLPCLPDSLWYESVHPEKTQSENSIFCELNAFLCTERITSTRWWSAAFMGQ